MNIKEYENCWIYARECERDIKIEDCFCVKVNDNITVVFGRKPSKRYSTHSSDIKFVKVLFDKYEFNKEAADDFWKNYSFRYYLKNDSQNRKIPLCVHIMEMENGDYLCIIKNNSQGKEFIKTQLNYLHSGEIL